MKGISIIIIVKNDFRIDKLLSKIKTIPVPNPFETIVVDASNGILKDIEQKHKKVKWIHFKTGKKQRTFSEQRNLGIKNAKGDIIVFIDADCTPHKDWLKELIHPINNEKEYIVSGTVRPIGKNQIHKQEQYGKYRDECETMNIAIAKEVIDSVGLFDENMEGCEDSDFCIRARNKGYKILFEPNAVVYHDWGGFMQNLKRSFNGGQDRMSLYKKYPQLFFTFSINTIYTWYYLFFLIFLPVTIYFPIYVFILFIPSLIKFRNPIKEIYNLLFSVGFLVKFFIYILKV